MKKKLSIVLFLFIFLVSSCMFIISESMNYDKALHELKRSWVLLRTDFNQSPVEDRTVIMSLAMLAQGIEGGILGIEEFMEVIDYSSEREVAMLKEDFKNTFLLIDTFDQMFSEALIILEEEKKEVIPEIIPETKQEKGFFIQMSF